jgi:hypothetical protein
VLQFVMWVTPPTFKYVFTNQLLDAITVGMLTPTK